MNKEDLRVLYEGLAISQPETDAALREEVGTSLLPATVANFSYEIRMGHSGYDQDDRTRLFGDNDYTQGDFYERMEKMLSNKHNESRAH